MTQMSSHDTWLDRISAGLAADRVPTSRIRTPISAQRMRWYKCGTVRCSRRSKAMPTNWNGSSTSVSTTKANAIRMTRIMKSFVEFGNAARRTSRAIARRLYATQPGRDKKMRPRSDAATDGGRLGRVI